MAPGFFRHRAGPRLVLLSGLAILPAAGCPPGEYFPALDTGAVERLRGHTPDLPSTSIAVPVSRIFAERGLDSAIAASRRLRDTDDRHYEFGMSDLITLGHDLRQTGRVREAIRSGTGGCVPGTGRHGTGRRELSHGLGYGTRAVRLPRVVLP